MENVNLPSTSTPSQSGQNHLAKQRSKTASKYDFVKVRLNFFRLFSMLFAGHEQVGFDVEHVLSHRGSPVS